MVAQLFKFTKNHWIVHLKASEFNDLEITT